MARLLTLLVLLTGLGACATVAQPAPPSRPRRGAPDASSDTVGVMALWGSSGSQRFYRDHVEVYTNEFEALTGWRSVVLDAAAGGSKLLPQPQARDWHPTSGELYGEAIRISREGYRQAQRENPGAVVVPVGIFWSHGNDQGRIQAGQATILDYMAALRLLMDSVQRDLLGVPFFLVGTATRHDSPLAEGADFRRAERATCEAHPNCTYVIDSVEMAWRGYHACDSDACRRSYYTDPGHYGPLPNTIVGLEGARRAARSVAERAAAGSLSSSFTGTSGQQP